MTLFGMKSIVLFLFAIAFSHFNLNAARKVNVAVTLHQKDIHLTFEESEIWGVQAINKSAGIFRVEVVVDASKWASIINNRNAIAFDFEMIAADAEEVLRQTQLRLNKRTKWTPSRSPSNQTANQITAKNKDKNREIFFEEYRDWDEYVLFIDDLVLSFPDLLTKQVIGETIEGRDILMIGISADDNIPNKPGVFIQAEVHAREWLANSATLYILNALAEGYGIDDEITDALNSANFYIAPTINVDGYIYTWQGANQRFWRKNRRNNGDGTFGVDLNRNWDGPPGVWCTSGASSNPNSNTYCGTAAFSEPESSAGAEFLMNPAYNIRVAVDMHTAGPLILWPWGYTYDQLPFVYYNEFRLLGEHLQTVTAAVHGVQYESMQSSGLYPASGTMPDFCWQHQTVEPHIFGFTFEGRGPGFDPPPSNIIPAGQEQLATMLALARAAAILP
jgi:murein tripeptide amidase MpaA